MKTYQFSLLRYVHDVSTEEFVNIGIVMWVPSEAKLLFQLTEHYARLSDFYADFNSNDYKYLLRSLRYRLESTKDLSFAAHIKNIDEILPDIVPIESGCFQWSSSMSGVVEHPELRLEKLYEKIIAFHEKNRLRKRRDEKDIIASFSKHLRTKGLLDHIDQNVPVFSSNMNYSYQFKYGWQNGRKQFAEPISLDYKNKKDMENKASNFIGDMFSLKDAEDFQVTGIVARPSQPELEDDFQITLNRLREAPNVREIVLEEEVKSFIQKIEQDIESHKR